MIRRPPRSPRTATLFPSTPLFRSEHGVAGLQQRQVYGHVGVGSGVGLHVGVVCFEERLGALAGDLLDLVDDLVAAVVALARVALAVLVGEDGSGRSQHVGRGEVLAGYELERGVLELDLAVDEREDLVVGVGGPGHGQDSSRSMSLIWARRRSWRSPSQAVDSHSARISLPRPVVTMRPPIDSPLASCFSGLRRAVEGSVRQIGIWSGGKRVAQCG